MKDEAMTKYLQNLIGDVERIKSMCNTVKSKVALIEIMASTIPSENKEGSVR